MLTSPAPQGSKLQEGLTIKVNNLVSVEKHIAADTSEITYSINIPALQQRICLKETTAADVSRAINLLMQDQTIEQEMERRSKSHIISLTEYLKTGKIVRL